MKVMCISSTDGGYPPSENDPAIGDICTVISECVGYDAMGNPEECYILAGYGSENDCYYQRDFAPLSNIDERELVNELKQTHI